MEWYKRIGLCVLTTNRIFEGCHSTICAAPNFTNEFKIGWDIVGRLAIDYNRFSILNHRYQTTLKGIGSKYESEIKRQ
jgi:hypothetical protein